MFELSKIIDGSSVSRMSGGVSIINHFRNEDQDGLQKIRHLYIPLGVVLNEYREPACPSNRIKYVYQKNEEDQIAENVFDTLLANIEKVTPSDNRTKKHNKIKKNMKISKNKRNY